MFVNGQLSVMGSESLPVRMTSSSAAEQSAYPGIWQGIQFSQSSIGAVFDQQTGEYVSGSNTAPILD